LNLLSFDYEQKTASFRVSCSSGTYVRSLAQDIAQSCGTLGFCSFIKRIRISNFDLANAVSVEKATERDVIPIENAIDFPKIELNEIDCGKIKNGNVITSSFTDISQIWLKHNNETIALGKIENGFVKPILVFN
jgi:tRNA pseudouridine55 synthase